MHAISGRLALPLLFCFSHILQPWAGFAASTIDAVNHSAYGGNIGWLDWRGDVTNGVVIGEYVCSGSIYAANVGWINLGSGSPVNGIQYQNNSASDYGVNRDGRGHLRGLAYGANIGWIVFTTNTATGPLPEEDVPRLNLTTGKFDGYVWSANCGWISLSNAFAHVQTDTIKPGADTDGDGITDAWELSYTNTLAAFNATSDTDEDGVSDLAESGADTSPLDATDQLRITAFSAQFGGGHETNALVWSSKETRLYQLAYRSNLVAAPWTDATPVFAPEAGSTTTRLLIFSGEPLQERYIRVRASKPLSP
jgi:hypothetical protein